MGLSSNVALLFLLAPIFYLLTKRVTYLWKRRIHGCSDPLRYQHRDPIFGLYLFFRASKEIREDRYIDQLPKLFEKYGDTFETLRMGEKRINTIDPEISRAVFTDQRNVWGVQPNRLAPMNFFCGERVMTCDGPLWRRSPKLLQSIFEKRAVADFPPSSHSFKECLRRFPAGYKPSICSHFCQVLCVTEHLQAHSCCS